MFTGYFSIPALRKVLQYAHFAVEGSVAERAVTPFRAHVESGGGSVFPAPADSEHCCILHSMKNITYKKENK